MIRMTMVALLLFGTSAAAQATGLSKAELGAVYAAPAANASLPLATRFTDERGTPTSLGDAIGGKPAVIVFADYTCTTLCGPIVAFAAAGLEKSGLVPGRDFHLVVIGIDPKDSLADARAMKATHVGVGTPLATATVMLVGTPDAIRGEAEAAGYHYIYDKTADQFAHPAAAYVVTSEGRVSRVLSGLGLGATDLRLALVDAGQGRVGTIADRLRLLCYCFDPETGIYSAAISRIMLAAGVLTFVALTGGISFLTFGVRRRAQS